MAEPVKSKPVEGEGKVEMVAKSCTFVLMALGAFLVYVFMAAPTITPQTQVGFAVGVFLILEGSFLTFTCNGWAIVRGINKWRTKA
jgi:hypothetical protein